MRFEWLRRNRGKAPRAVTFEDAVAYQVERRGLGTVVDIGANVGQYGTRLRAAGYRGRIVSFEPGAEAHAALTARASGDPQWTVAPRLALGAAAGSARLHRYNRSDMNALEPALAATHEAFPKLAAAGTESVDVARLDTVLPDLAPEGPLFVKIDTQGAEWAVLDGAEGVMPRIAGIQIEVSLLAMYEGERTWIDLLARLQTAGFAAWLTSPGNFSRTLGRQLQIDVALFRE